MYPKTMATPKIRISKNPFESKSSEDPVYEILSSYVFSFYKTLRKENFTETIGKIYYHMPTPNTDCSKILLNVDYEDRQHNVRCAH